jgi:hypothetical protein
MPGAGSCAVDQRERPAAVDDSDWLEQMRRRLSLECRDAIANLGQSEIEDFRNPRLRQPPFDDGLQDLPT